MQTELPLPSNELLQQSQQLVELMRAEMAISGCAMPFARYMELALYEPKIGYYQALRHKFGEQGDFVTAPEISPLFSYCLARQCQQILAELTGGSILEFGAGSGVMAADILLKLDELDSLPENYFILELSPALRLQQQQTISKKAKHLLARVTWLTSFPAKKMQGVVLANEVLDAMPVQRFRVDQEGIWEYYVDWKNDQLNWHLDVCSDPVLLSSVEALEIPISDAGYESEINLNIPGWLQAINQVLEKGSVLLLDYGFPQQEYYHPQRDSGTLMCHYRHRAHADPLLWPGLQDITAHVDFTAVALEASEINFDIAGFTSQAAFLMSCGITAMVEKNENDAAARMKIAQQMKLLTMPQEMGELVKVMMLSKGLDLSLLGFSLQDRRNRL